MCVCVFFDKAIGILFGNLARAPPPVLTFALSQAVVALFCFFLLAPSQHSLSDLGAFWSGKEPLLHCVLLLEVIWRRFVFFCSRHGHQR